MAPLCFSAPVCLRVSSFSARSCVIKRGTFSVFARRVAAPCATAAVPPSGPSPAAPPSPSTSTSPTSPPSPLFRCPVCKTSYPPVAALELSKLPPSCRTCGTKVVQRNGYVDLTRTTSSPPSLLRELLTARPSQALFQLPAISYAYERGWRNGFARAGFPGIDAELAMFLDFAAPADTVLDLSCGSGLMARRLATCGEFERVVAADYSEAMLRQTVDYMRKDVTVPEFDVVRADVAALPFVDGAVDVVHCGAALHCWPNVQDGLVETRRVLKPGGAFFATTFLKLAYWGRSEVLDRRPELRKAAIRAQELLPGEMAYRFFEKDELEYLLKAAGFVEVGVEERRGCAIIRCRKAEE